MAREMGDTRPQSVSVMYRLLVHLTAWFKHEFFTWVDTLACGQCGSTSTQNGGLINPTEAEMRHGAGRVEAHRCSVCGFTSRFPRYNDPAKLLDTRRGRCGEWANCFALCVRAAGFEIRFIHDVSDHVWVEVFSEDLDRWVCVDPCENQIDKPLLYTEGWGKMLTYVFAFHRCHSRDVTLRYVRDPKAILANRRAQPPAYHARTLDALISTENARIMGAADELDLVVWTDRLAMETVELYTPRTKDTATALPGRATGSVEWRVARGECGSGAAGVLDSGAQGGECRRPDGTEEDGGTRCV